MQARAFAASLFVTLVALPLPAFALGDAALVFIAPSSLTVGYDGLRFDLQEAGASRVDLVGAWPTTDLATEYRLVVITPYEGPLDGAIADDLAAFAAAGGGVVLLAEHLGGLEAGNALAERLGVSPRFEPFDTGPGCSSAPVVTDEAVTAGAPTLELAWGLTVSGGTTLYGFPDLVVAARDRNVVLVGDADPFYDASGFGGCPYGPSTQTFHRNLFTALPDEGGASGSDAGVAPDAGGSVLGELGATCATGGDCLSGLCITVGARSHCSETCEGTCPSPFVCSAAGGTHVCTEPSSGGCSVSHRPSAVWAVLALVALALARARL